MKNQYLKRQIALIMTVVMLFACIPGDTFSILASEIESGEKASGNEFIWNCEMTPSDGSAFYDGWTNQNVQFHVEATATDGSVKGVVYSEEDLSEKGDISNLGDEHWLASEEIGKYYYEVIGTDNECLETERYFYAVDEQNRILKSADKTIKIDKKAPEISEIDCSYKEQPVGSFAGMSRESTLNTLVFKDKVSITIKVKAKDEGSGIKSISYQVKDGIWSELELPDIPDKPDESGYSTYTFELILPQNIKGKSGDNCFQVGLKAVDNCGNVSDVKCSDKTIIVATEDQLRLDVELMLEDESDTGYVSGEWTNQNVKAVVSSYYNTKKLIGAKYQYRQDSLGWKDINNDENSILFKVDEGKILSMPVTFRNANMSDESGPFEVKIDKEKPEINILKITGSNGSEINNWYNGDVTASGVVNEAGSGIEKIMCQYVAYDEEGQAAEPPHAITDIENFAKVSDIKITEGKPVEFTYAIQAPEEGEINGIYYFYAVDKAGNVSDKGAVEVKLTKELPEITNITAVESKNETGYKEGEWIGEDIKVKVKVIPSPAGISFVKMGGGEAEEVTGILDENSGEYVFDIKTNADTVLNQIYSFTATDNAGNVSEEKTFKVMIDKEKPVIESVKFDTSVKMINNVLEENEFAGFCDLPVARNSNLNRIVFRKSIKIVIHVEDKNGSGIKEDGFCYCIKRDGKEENKAFAQKNIVNKGDGIYEMIIDSLADDFKDTDLNIEVQISDNCNKVSTASVENDEGNTAILASMEKTKVQAAAETLETKKSYTWGEWTNQDVSIKLGTYYILGDNKLGLSWNAEGQNYRYAVKCSEQAEWEKLDKDSFTIEVEDGKVLDGKYSFINQSLVEAEQTSSAEYSVKVDKKKPVINSLKAADINENEINCWYNQKVSLLAAVEEEHSGAVLFIKYVPEGSDAEKIEYEQITSDGTAVAGTSEYKFKYDVEPEKNGNYYIYARDGAGNTSEVKQIKVRLDNTPPKVQTVNKELRDKDGNVISTIDNQEEAIWNRKGDNLFITGTVRDNLSGVNRVVYQYVQEGDKGEVKYSEESVSTADELEKDNYTIYIPNETEDKKPVNLNGTYYIWTVDNAGNVSLPNTIEIKLDNTLPEVKTVKKEVQNEKGTTTIDNTAEVVWNRKGDVLSIKGKVGDNLSGIDRVVYQYVQEGDKGEVKYSEESVSTADELEKDNYTIYIPNETEDKKPVNLNGTYYIWTVDNAGNVSSPNKIKIKLDNTVPKNLTMKVSYQEDGKEKNSDITEEYTHSQDKLKSLKFKLFYNTEIQVDLGVDKEKDIESGILKMEYWKIQKELYQDVLKASNINDIIDEEQQNWIEYEEGSKISISPNDQFMICFRVTDKAGNETIRISDGIVVDDKAPVGEDYQQPEIKITPEESNKNGYYGTEYGENILVKVVVSDPLYTDKEPTDDKENGYYSGLNNISYRIIVDGKVKEEDIIFQADTVYDELSQQIVRTIKIPMDTTNSNHVIVEVTAIDNAGNKKTSSTQDGDIKIDITEPTINISYDNNQPLNDKYYDDDRTAFITVTERNFNPEDVVLNLTNPYGKVPEISSWTTVETAGNGDGTKHQATITWHEDGDYQFGISYKDLAGNQDTGMNFAAGTKNETFFVMDQTNPEINISYRNNSPSNEKYYNADRVAEITVTERNFKPEEVNIQIENPYGNVPEISEWTSSGLKHTAYLAYREDGDYTFHIGYADLAGNKNNAEKYSAVSKNTNYFVIDKTAPEIFVSYNNNAPSEEKYYNADRLATINIVERNFKGEEVITEIQNTDGVIPDLSGWSRENITNSSSITYAADGDYTFDMKYTDLAGNTAGSVQYAENTANASEFTIDKTAPVVTVSYDNEALTNGKYFKAGRTATISVNEHNFNPADITYTQTALKNGQVIEVPTVSDWSDAEDIHTATIRYQADGDYTFDMTMTDMSGNQSGAINYASAVAQDFTVDMSISKPEITGVENGKAYKDNVIPVIHFEDINLDGNYEVKLTRTRKDVLNEDVTEQFVGNLIKNEGHSVTGEINTFEKVQENDGIYTLYVAYEDLAGNKEENTVVFSVNRFGSVYALSEDLQKLKNSYVQKVDGNLVITEYNADKLVEDSLQVEITKDGQRLKEKAVYTVTPEINQMVSVGESGWYQYAYTIDKENFSDDGVYKIIVSSKDEAGNNPETTLYEDCQIVFTVDTVAPEITNIKGLEKAVVNATELQVDYAVFDSIGLKSVKAYIDEREVVRQEKFDDLSTSNGKFTITAGTNQHIRLVATDLAGNTIDTDSDGFSPVYGFEDNITVSTNFFVRWYAQKALFYGSIVGTVVVIGGLAAVVVLLRRRREETVHTA